MSRSAPARVQVELIPAELREWHQWVCWRWEKRKDKNGNDTWTKPPMQPNGEYANSTNPETWTSFDNALAALQAGRGLAGIGFVFAMIAVIHKTASFSPGLDSSSSASIPTPRFPHPEPASKPGYGRSFLLAAGIVTGARMKAGKLKSTAAVGTSL